MHLPSEVKLVTLTAPKIKQLWEKQKNFDVLFTDDTRGKEETFIRGLLDDATQIFELVDGQGILVLNHISPGSSATAHLSFWDHKMLPRVGVVKQTLMWAFINWDLRSVQVYAPERSRAVHRFVTKRLGFKPVGVLRNYSWHDSRLVNLHMFDLIREEILNGR